MGLLAVLLPARWRGFRLFLSLVYLGLLFSVAGYLYRQVLYFEGDLFLDTNTLAQWVVRPAGGSGALFSAQRNMPAGVILPAFENRIAARYGRDTSVDVVALGLGIRLTSVKLLEEYPPREELTIEGPGGTRTESVQPGKDITLDSVKVRMLDVRPWAGLVRSSQGGPMACLTMRGGADTTPAPLFLRADHWQNAASSTLFCLRWFSDQPSAEKALSERLEDSGARWGTTEGKRTQAFSSFAPGTGVTLQDGTEVTLVERRPAENGHSSALVVDTRRDGSSRQWTIEANRRVDGIPLFYSCPSEAQEAIVLHAWQDGEALVASYRQGALTSKQMHKEGGSFAVSTQTISIRLDQVMSKAAAAKPEPDGAWQLMIDAGQGETGLRQGMAVSLGDYRLTYHRLLPPPRLQYTLAVRGREIESAGREVIMESGRGKRIGGWRITAPVEPANATQGLVMHTERSLGGPASLLGAFLFITGSVGWVLCYYFAPRPSR